MNKKQKQDNNSMEELLSSHDFDLKPLRRGSLIDSLIVGQTENDFLVDLGGKFEGVLPFSEVLDFRKYQIGDRVKVLVITPEDRQGQLLVSEKRARSVSAWKKIKKSLEEGIPIDSKIVDFNRGGLIVDVMGLQGFLPFSQMISSPIFDDLRENSTAVFPEIKGKKIQVRVLESDMMQGRIIVSEREAEAESRRVKEEALADNLKEGEIVETKIKQILPYGLLVEVQGVDALIEKSELSWQKNEEALTTFSIDQKIKAKVIHLPDEEDEVRLTLSIKQVNENPWLKLEGSLSNGVAVEGKVIKVTSFGIVVELIAGIEGLVPLSELPEAGLEAQVGDVLILDIKALDKNSGRLELRMKS